ncbi:MAG: Uncharacterized protein Athens071416_567 [Parcubacteria group bacterium Athens0714_16]|nr:MAG: Uncharacterized protein Athens071416_567 [Parcubacteria group bacterium Athens0714_16]
MINTLDDVYELYLGEVSDINELLPILKKYAEDCSHITEFGTRDGISTVAFLMAKPNRLITYDINRGSQINELEKLAKENLIDFSFIEKSVLEIEIEETDLLFIDTLHTYDQLKQELLLHGNKAKKYIILHDTETFGCKGCYGVEPGLNKAIEEFVANNNWRIKEVITINNGLTVLERTKEI